MKDTGVVFLAVNWPRIDDVLNQAGDLSDKVIVTCMLPMDAGNTGLVVAHTSSGAEELAKKAKKAKVVSAFNTVPSEVLSGVFDARGDPNVPIEDVSGTVHRRAALSDTASGGLLAAGARAGGSRHLRRAWRILCCNARVKSESAWLWAPTRAT